MALEPPELRTLQQAAELLGAHAKLLKAFGTGPNSKAWFDSPETKAAKREHDQCLSLQKQLGRLASNQRPVRDGMMVGEDI